MFFVLALASTHASALMTPSTEPLPSVRSTRSAMSDASGAMPERSPKELKPLPPIVPATCVPWPLVSQTPPFSLQGASVKSMKSVTRVAPGARPRPCQASNSSLCVMPESRMATPTPAPVTPTIRRAKNAPL